MTRSSIIAALSLFLSACGTNGFWDAALNGMCIASEASCMKDCYRDDNGRYAGGYGAKACEASCTSGGSGCAFTD
ncbi:MAG: hypothetical protein AAFW81_06205 [Pseudomonadota bacterium]